MYSIGNFCRLYAMVNKSIWATRALQHPRPLTRFRQKRKDRDLE